MTPGGAARNEWLLIPNLLTLSRFAAAALVPLCFVLAEPATAEVWALGLFVYASITDFADGYLARRLNQMSALGAQLDTLADKALLITTLAALLLSSYRYEPWFWAGALLIALREVGLTALRRWFRGSGALKVTLAAKWKTTFQMTAVSALLAVGLVERTVGAGAGQALESVGIVLFLIAVALTVWTGVAYLRAALSAARSSGGAPQA